jgi:hypothetical protein
MIFDLMPAGALRPFYPENVHGLQQRPAIIPGLDECDHLLESFHVLENRHTLHHGILVAATPEDPVPHDTRIASLRISLRRRNQLET